MLVIPGFQLQDLVPQLRNQDTALPVPMHAHLDLLLQALPLQLLTTQALLARFDPPAMASHTPARKTPSFTLLCSSSSPLLSNKGAPTYSLPAPHPVKFFLLFGHIQMGDVKLGHPEGQDKEEHEDRVMPRGP